VAMGRRQGGDTATARSVVIFDEFDESPLLSHRTPRAIDDRDGDTRGFS
jgi:hypothetical protein